MRKTKIVITMGPGLLEGSRLLEALEIADVVRLNASHGDILAVPDHLRKERKSVCPAGHATVPERVAGKRIQGRQACNLIKFGIFEGKRTSRLKIRMPQSL